jgi:hypothetical protein
MTMNHPLDRRVLILGASGMLGNALFRFFRKVTVTPHLVPFAQKLQNRYFLKYGKQT